MPELLQMKISNKYPALSLVSAQTVLSETPAHGRDIWDSLALVVELTQQIC
jgi:hypothetical protein